MSAHQGNLNAEKLREFIAGLDDFQIQERDTETYAHMGATLTDAALQAGIHYDNVVRPRIKEILEKYPDARTTSKFLNLLREKGPGYVLNWQGEKKIKTLLALAELLRAEGIETETQLAQWLQDQDRRGTLYAISGVGPKTYDYLWLLCSLDAVAVDVHLMRFAAQAGVKGEYAQVRDAVARTASLLGRSATQLDKAIWLYQSKRRQ
ncbi:hypothetical protein [Deinococcus fonticola]|uniref:hypothetical protein n=1 Tax=Deinococcus fonticola TaxID=2528713 RepID=UPI001074F9D5|nr:hypothetical protein [Deinococcus fonticola]